MILKAKQIVFLLITFASLALVSFSQTIPCELNIKVFDIDSVSTLSDLNIKFTKFETKQIYKASETPDSLVFSSLNSGIYQIELSKKGYKRKIKKFFVDCGFADSSNKFFENIFLWKGNSKDIIKLDSTNIAGSFSLGEENSANRENTAFVVEGKNEPLNNKATNLIRPNYPPAARAVWATGAVSVQVTIDEDGNIVKAEALDGHALLRAVSVKAARQSKFSSTRLEGKPVKVTGVIVYNFKAQ